MQRKPSLLKMSTRPKIMKKSNLFMWILVDFPKIIFL